MILPSQGVYAVSASAEGYRPSRAVHIRPAVGAHQPVIDLVLREGAKVSGVVVDEETEAPVVGAQIVSELGGTLLTRSDDEGKFVVSGARAGRWSRLAVQAPGYASHVLRNVAPGDEVRVELGRGRTIRGAVGGGALGDWYARRLELRSYSRRGGTKDVRAAAIAADGSWSVEAFEPAEFIVLRLPVAGGGQIMRWHVPQVGDGPIEVPPIAWGHLGSVIAEVTTPLDAGFGVLELRRDYAGTLPKDWLLSKSALHTLGSRHAPLSPGGESVRLISLEPGSYVASVSVTGWPIVEQKIEVAPGENGRVRLTVVPGQVVMGRVVLGDPGAALPGASVSLGAAYCPTDSNGSFRFGGLERDKPYELQVRVPRADSRFEGRPQPLAQVRVRAPTASATIKIPHDNDVSGRLLTENGRPLSGGRIFADRNGQTVAEGTGDDGRFVLWSVGSGSVDVRAQFLNADGEVVAEGRVDSVEPGTHDVRLTVRGR